jgi:hypothetical protein
MRANMSVKRWPTRNRISHMFIQRLCIGVLMLVANACAGNTEHAKTSAIAAAVVSPRADISLQDDLYRIEHS